MIYSCWDKEQNLLKLVILGHFSTFTSLKIQKKILKNEKNLLEISSFYTSVPKITIIWCMVPETWSETNKIFCYLGHFLPIFRLFHPSNDPKNQNFEKMKTTPGDIILHLCTTNENHMIIVCIGVPTPHSETPPPLYLAKPPPLKSVNCPSPPPLFRQSPPLYWFFINPLKIWFFSEPQKY